MFMLEKMWVNHKWEYIVILIVVGIVCFLINKIPEKKK